MTEATKMLTLLQVVVPGDTPISVPSEIRILELLGIVSNPELTNALNLTAALVPATTQGTLFGLIKILGNLVKMHPKATKAHYEALAEVLKGFTGVPDSLLTFSSFLSICDALMKAPAHKIGKGA